MNGRQEVLRVLAGRVTADRVRAGARADGRRVALVIEGGGMRGAISGGMALAVHELGFVPAFDAVYGSSAGTISGAWLLSSYPEGLRGWADPEYARALIHRRAALRGKPIVEVETLIEEVYQTTFPLDYDSVLASAVEFHPMGTDAVTGLSTDLRPLIHDAAGLRLAMRASAALPLLAGPAVELDGHRFYDAGLSESIPYRTALAQGATHMLVLRSRRDPVTTTRPTRSDLVVAHNGLRKQTPELQAAFLARAARLAADDARLAHYDAAPDGPPWVTSIRPAPDTPQVSRLATDGPLLESAFGAGRAAVHAAFATTSR
ncbi:MAG TPA: patatin-like phospholipase family protein [Streptosporangiaceae bacterium]